MLSRRELPNRISEVSRRVSGHSRLELVSVRLNACFMVELSLPYELRKPNKVCKIVVYRASGSGRSKAICQVCSESQKTFGRVMLSKRKTSSRVSGVYNRVFRHARNELVCERVCQVEFSGCTTEFFLQASSEKRRKFIQKKFLKCNKLVSDWCGLGSLDYSSQYLRWTLHERAPKIK